jgi:putative peptidoglycan lipid II flippase
MTSDQAAAPDAAPSMPPTASTRPRPSLVRTAFRLLPFQVALRGGEALLPLFLAAWFGRSVETDLYYLFATYFVFASAVLTGAFQDSAVIPVLIEVEASDPGAMPAIAGALLGHTLAIGAAVGLGTGAIAFGVAALATPLHAVACELVALMAASVVAVGVRAFYVGLLNARGAFHAYPVGSGLGTALMFALVYAGRGFGVRIIPLASLAGELLAIVVLASLARRALGARVRPNLQRPEPVRRIFTLVRLEVAGTLVTRVNPFVDQLMAGFAGVVGGGTLLRYAGDVAALPTSILQAVLFPVLLTRLAGEVTHPAVFAATTRRTLIVVVLLLAALSGGMIALRAPICELLFLHGAMDRGGVARIAGILPWALAGAAPFGALLVLARAHVALQNSRIMPGMGVLNSLLNVGMNAALVGVLGLGGLSLATSLTYVIVAVVFWLRLPKAARA